MVEADVIANGKFVLSKGHVHYLNYNIYLNYFLMKYNLEKKTNNHEAIEKIIRKYNNKTTINDSKYNMISYASSFHIWILPIECSPLFYSHLKNLEREKGHALHVFLLNVPILE
ncbi:hypothetical protein U3516DRAFT_549057 [Neocallimastix sp. 'constans']|jgi:hypothetical protein